MRYQGGKSRIAKNIAGIINSYAGAGGANALCQLILRELRGGKQNTGFLSRYLQR